VKCIIKIIIIQIFLKSFKPSGWSVHHHVLRSRIIRSLYTVRLLVLHGSQKTSALSIQN